MTQAMVSLGINWKLLLLQIVDFAIIFYVFKAFMYKPVLNILAARRKKIAESVKQAERIEREMEEIKNTREEILFSAKKEASQTLMLAKKQSEDLRRELTEATQRRIETMLEDGKKMLAAERDNIISSAKKEIGELALTISERIMNEKMDARTGGKLIEEALDQISNN